MQKIENMIGARDKIGYAAGDMGCQLTFGLVGMYLQMFYTDILGISTGAIIVLMAVVRLWDAATDPIWGGLVDRLRPGRHGRFRPWLLWSSLPLAGTAVLMFTNPGFGPQGNLIWAYATFIAYGMCYTIANISYGAMASVISPLEGDRSALSTFRSIGAGLGALPVALILPAFVFWRDDYGRDHLHAGNLRLAVVILGALSLLIFVAAFLMTRERVVNENRRQQAGKTLRALIKNRPFIVICLASMLHIGVMLFTQTMHGYLFRDYFHNTDLIIWYYVFTFSPMVVLFPVMPKLVRRFGKKEICSASLVLSVLSYGAAFLFTPTNPWIYLALCFVFGLGMTCFTMQVWALVTDVLDFQHKLSGQHDEGSAFGVYFFTRKIGHTLAGMGGGVVLNVIGYVVGTQANPVTQTPEVALGLYRATTLVPTVALLIMFLLLQFAYPLSKKRLAEMNAK